MSALHFEPLNNNIKLSFDENIGASIKVIGIGGGGCNAIDGMIKAGIKGVTFLAANTDMQALRQSHAPIKLQLGAKLTKGLGAGANPEVGRQAALEDTEKIIELLGDTDMVFITSGLGGGTGGGAAPIVADLAVELGALTVAVVTKPFAFEGKKRMQQAEQGLVELKESADTVITIPNERLLATVTTDATLTDAFECVDDVLRQAVQGISDLITIPGIINLDFADVKTIMTNMGMSLMGTGIAEGDGRARAAAAQAINSPLLENSTIQDAQGIIINITGNREMTLQEVSEASHIIQESADPEANIIFGSVFDDEMGRKIKITVIATGFRVATVPRGYRPLRPTLAAQEEDLQSNTFPRSQHDSTDGNLTNQSELDVPAFLRHRIKK